MENSAQTKGQCASDAPDYRLSHLNKSFDYHSSFQDQRHRALVWELEKRSLVHITRHHFKGRRPVHLDFACGTGRILTFLESRCASSTGVDVSASMLSVARQNSPNADLIQADITRDPVIQDRRFDLITAFRFFPNAQPALRYEAIRALTPLLKDDGIIVFNNHLNATSLLRTARKLGGKELAHCMSNTEVNDLARDGRLQVTRRLGLSILPIPDRYIFCPTQLIAVEWTMTNAKVLRRFAQNQIYVASRRKC